MRKTYNQRKRDRARQAAKTNTIRMKKARKWQGENRFWTSIFK